MSETPAIRVQDLTVYYGRTPALKNVCLTVNDREFLGIIGPNGGGKSTLLRAILGLVRPASGKIEIYGLDARENRALIGYVPQFSMVDRKFPISALEVVMTAELKGGLHPFFRYNALSRAHAIDQLTRVGLGKLANRQISELSGGEFQRLLVARALAVNPRILLLDEPTASADPASRSHIYDLLEELNRELTILLVTHDMLAISSKVHTIACLNGSLIYHGEPELNEAIVDTLYGCPVDLIAHGVPHRVLGEHKQEDACACSKH